MRTNWLNYLALALMGAVLVAGCFYLAEKDASVGSGYAGYSSFRADPAGCKVLYESLAGLSDLNVSRNYREHGQWKVTGATLFVLGISELSLLEKDAAYFAEWERLSKSNRIVLSIAPSSEMADLSSERKKSQLGKRWGLEIGKAPASEGTWHRTFDRYEGWEVLARSGEKPVVLERRFGNGVVVIASDTRMFTNAALAEYPQSELLARVVGPNRRIEFDESHLGITETGSVMGLARKYRLQGILAGLAILAALFLWSRAAEFPSVVSGEVTAESAVVGREAQAGFIGLLRRHISEKQLTDECLNQWRKTSPRDERFLRMQDAAAAESEPLRAYARIQDELRTRGKLRYERKS